MAGAPLHVLLLTQSQLPLHTRGHQSRPGRRSSAPAACPQYTSPAAGSVGRGCVCCWCGGAGCACTAHSRRRLMTLVARASLPSHCHVEIASAVLLLQNFNRVCQALPEACPVQEVGFETNPDKYPTVRSHLGSINLIVLDPRTGAPLQRPPRVVRPQPLAVAVQQAAGSDGWAAGRRARQCRHAPILWPVTEAGCCGVVADASTSEPVRGGCGWKGGGRARPLCAGAVLSGGCRKKEA